MSALSAQKAHLTEVESHSPAHQQVGVTPGQFLGDVSPTEAWRALQDHAEAILVDVRTRAEWAFVGGPDLARLGKTVVQIEWAVFPGMERNPRFVKGFQAKGITPQQPVYLICRSGVRSRQAAERLAEPLNDSPNGAMPPTTWRMALKVRLTVTAIAASAAGAPSSCPGSRRDPAVSEIPETGLAGALGLRGRTGWNSIQGCRGGFRHEAPDSFAS